MVQNGKIVSSESVGVLSNLEARSRFLSSTNVVKSVVLTNYVGEVELVTAEAQCDWICNTSGTTYVAILFASLV